MEYKKPNRQLTTVQYIAKVENRFPDKFTFDKTIYNGQFNELTITCKLHGDFIEKANNLFNRKYGCLKCETDYRFKSIMVKVIKKHGSTYDYSLVDYSNANTPVKIICQDHGIFEMDLYSHSIGKRCLKCATVGRTKTLEYFVKKASNIHGNRYDYSKTKYLNAKVSVIITCNIHGDFEQKPYSHLSGNGCLECSILEKTSNNVGFIDKAKLIHSDKYDYAKVKYINNKKKVIINCKRHGDFRIQPNRHLSGQGCKRCRSSRGENMIYTLLRNNNIPFKTEYILKGHLFRYDFYIPSINLLIEYHGEQHYKPVKKFGGRAGFLKTQFRDNKKIELAIERCIPLLVVNYRDMKNNCLTSKVVSHLKKYYQHWYLIRGELVITNKILELTKHYEIPKTLLLKDIEQYILENHDNFKILFTSGSL